MTAATIALTAALLTFGGGIAGLLYDKLVPEHQVPDGTRALIKAQKSLQSKAADLMASIEDLRLETRLQIA